MDGRQAGRNWPGWPARAGWLRATTPTSPSSPPSEGFVVDVHKLHHKNPVSPYEGKALTGVVRRTFVRGREVDGRQPGGQLLRRGEA